MAVLALGRGTRRFVRNFNWLLAAGGLLIAIIGLVCIRSAGLRSPDAAGEFSKQVAYLVLGMAIMVGVSLIDYRTWQRWAPALYAINLLLLLFILRSGHAAMGAQRWISLGPLGTFQPSEPAKLVIAISLAAVLCRGTYENLQDLWKPLLTVAVPALLILKQPDLGTSLVLMAILSVELFFALPKLGDFGIYALAVLVVAAGAIGTNAVLKPFQRARLFVFLNPKADPQGSGYNLNQSKIAVGNGEWFGRGLYHGTQTQLNFVPEHSRDFIFTVLAEEWGFAGAALLLFLYAAVLYGGIRAMLAARDRFGFLLSAGLVGMLFFHVLINVGMTIGIMPITGIPLPFVSYGGSALLTDFAAIGILLNVYSQRDRDMLGNA
ncbi:MAG: rod shape-determining protein RodA [Candidatus Eremiobacteraeota bacterium]|nr:rod shape-determining protein RodA [Candidatus Eremiobacteraeota bacterium]MBV8498880.1 rod shape-determining protein RodA [Candidatus Eremiobacteraeota bacterium]